jgi:hypothetical protein
VVPDPSRGEKIAGVETEAFTWYVGDAAGSFEFWVYKKK